jgi:hypothetical protein
MPSKHEDMLICTLCLKDFDVSYMGEAALKSHAKGSKHTKLAKQPSEEKSKAQSHISDLWSTDSNATTVSCSKITIVVSTASVNVEKESRPVSTAKANPNGRSCGRKQLGVVDEMCNFRDESQHCSELNAVFQAFSTSV